MFRIKRCSGEEYTKLIGLVKLQDLSAIGEPREYGGRNRAYVMYSGDDMVAYANLFDIIGDGTIYTDIVYVLEDYRGSGYGNELLKRLTKMTDKPIVAFVDKDNATSRGIHRSNGFLEISRDDPLLKYIYSRNENAKMSFEKDSKTRYFLRGVE